jgi:hypothetical protein
MYVDESKVVATLINPSDDGVTHINVYSKGRTRLGRGLSNFDHLRFVHPRYGTFASMEAYWYWVASGMTHDELRPLFGFSAKSQGIRLPKVNLIPFEFQQLIVEGLICKISQHPDLLKDFIHSTLPFKHYFVYGKVEPHVRQMVIDQTAKHQWQMDALTNLRFYWQAAFCGRQPPNHLFEGTVLTLLQEVTAVLLSTTTALNRALSASISPSP